MTLFAKASVIGGAQSHRPRSPAREPDAKFSLLVLDVDGRVEVSPRRPAYSGAAIAFVAGEDEAFRQASAAAARAATAAALVRSSSPSASLRAVKSTKWVTM